MSRVTVCIPFHDDSPYVFYALISALRQSYRDLRVLLVSDGAPESIVDRLDSIDDPRVSIVHDGERKGLSERLNQSIELVDTEFYFRMDADDIMAPDRVAVQLNALRESPCIGALGSSAILINGENEILGKRLAREGTVDAASAFDPNPFMHPTVAFRMSWLANRRYQSTYSRAEDRRFWIENFEAGVYANLSAPLLYYRVRSTQPVWIVSRTASEERALLREFASPSVGRIVWLARSYIKEAIQVPLEVSKMSQYFSSRRGTALSDREAIWASDALRTVSDSTERAFGTCLREA